MTDIVYKPPGNFQDRVYPGGWTIRRVVTYFLLVK